MKREPIKSSNLASVGYDASSKTLDIEFNSGKIYRYYQVPEDIYSQLMKAESAGKYFSATIRNVYESNEIGDKPMVINNLTADQKKELLAQFNTVYECKELGEHEYKIIYLAWLWANGFVVKSESGMSTFDAGEAGVPITDYEITIEDERKGGVNLDLTRMYYDIDKIIKLIIRDK
jgi:hypothetical protein